MGDLKNPLSEIGSRRSRTEQDGGLREVEDRLNMVPIMTLVFYQELEAEGQRQSRMVVRGRSRTN